MNSFRTTLTAAAITTLALAAGGCTAVDRAGGKADDPVTTLTLAQPNDGGPPAQMVAWAVEVERASDGALEIAFENGWRKNQDGNETGTIADLRAGKVDLAWVGARVFDRVGVTDFQALLAPTLVDSHDLQAAVFEEGIPEEMLAGVADAGVTGIGVLPGPMRKVLGVHKPFLEPRDFQGSAVGMQDSALVQATMEALGATTKAVPGGARLDGLDAYEQQLSSISGNGYVTEAHFVTANLDLWPRPLVVIANTDVFEDLTDEQRTALTGASSAALLPALDASREEDAEGARQLCKQGMALVDAEEEQRDALLGAWGPLYDDLAGDPQTAGWLERIRELKLSLGAGPDTAACDAAETKPPAGVLPNGTYRATLTVDEVRAGCRPGDPGADALAEITTDQTLEMTIEGDRVVQRQYPVGHPEQVEQGWVGSYRTFRDTFQLLESGAPEPLASTFDFDGRRLLLTDMQTDFCDHKTIWTGHAWSLVEQAPGDGTTDPVEGDYRAVIDWPTVDSSDGACIAGPEGAGVNVYELTLHDGRVSLSVRIGGPDAEPEHGYTGSYRVFRDQIELNDGTPLTAHVDVDDERLTLSDMTGGRCGDRAVWTTTPWERVDDQAATTNELVGVWTAQLTAADWNAAGFDGPAGTWVMTFEDDTVTVKEPDGDLGSRASYEAFRGRLVTSESIDVLHAGYRVEGDLLYLTDVSVPGADDGGPYALVWESHPWERQGD